MTVDPGTLLQISRGVNAIGGYYATKAEAINKQTINLLKANDVLFTAEMNAFFDQDVADVHAGRILQDAKTKALNHRGIANKLLRDHRRTQASIRARAAANGVAYGEGSVASFERANFEQTMLDVGVANFNELTALVAGFEDAAALRENAARQASINMYEAKAQARQYELGADAAVTSGDYKATQQLIEAGYDIYELRTQKQNVTKR